MRVLVTDAQYVHTLSLVRALGVEGKEVHLLSPTWRALSFFSRFCQMKYVCPPPRNEEEFLKFLLDLTKARYFDVLIPVSHESVKVVAKYRPLLSRFVRAEVPEAGRVLFALNKKRVYQLASKLGIPVPKTFYPRSRAEALSALKQIRLSGVVKPIWETGGSSCRFPRTSVEFVRDFEECQRLWGEVLVQESISGDLSTYCVALLYQRGRCKRIFMHKEKRSLPTSGGSGVFVESIFEEKLKRYSLKLLDALEWHGVALVEFKRDPERDEFFLMEVNPKFWASLEVAIRAGVNFPSLLCQMASGEEIPYSEDYKLGVKVWFPARELQRIFEDPFSIPQILSALFSQKVSTNVWLFDPLPHVLEFAHAISSIPPFERLRNWARRGRQGAF